MGALEFIFVELNDVSNAYTVRDGPSNYKFYYLHIGFLSILFWPIYE